MVAGYHYQFVSTVDDILEAEAMERAEQLQRWLIWLVAGLAFLALFLLAFFDGFLRFLLIIVAISALVYHFGVKPIQTRKRIRAEGRPRQQMRLEFAREGIVVDVEGVGAVRRSWNDFKRAADMSRGVLIYFLDGRMWLPGRVFSSDDERRAFVEFVRRYEAPDTPP